MNKLEVLCESCNKNNLKLVRGFTPEEFSNSGMKSVLFYGHCDFCHIPLAMRYEYYRDENNDIKTRIKKKIDPNSILKSLSAEAEDKKNLTVKTKRHPFLAKCPPRKEDVDIIDSEHREEDDTPLTTLEGELYE